MKKLLKRIGDGNGGFTLVELLIVIAVIGILAVAVLTAINPIEQLKKSRDAGRLADARELYNAVQRYSASYPCNPWESTIAVHNCLAPANQMAGVICNWTANFGAGMCGDLLNVNELKASFPTKTTITTNIFVSEANAGITSVCFEPESTAGRAGSSMGPTRNVANTAAMACAGTYAGNVSTTCMVCI